MKNKNPFFSIKKTEESQIQSYQLYPITTFTIYVYKLCIDHLFVYKLNIFFATTTILYFVRARNMEPRNQNPSEADDFMV